MSSWIYIFSKFTPEALLFESAAICMLCAGYAAFWVLKKRKVGVIDTEVPAGVIRGYLSELIGDAEQLRAQLFGLLRSAGMDLGDAGPRPAAAGTTAVTDAAMLQKLAQFETKIAEKDKAMQAMLADKVKMERDLAAAKEASKGAAASAGGDAAAMAPLQEKISNLEAKLAEYSVIEDDLANLKRLQQENAQLKAALAGQGGMPEAVISAPVAAAPAPAPVMAAPAPAPAAPAAAPEPVAALAAAETDVFSGQAAAPDASFEGLVDQVEQSLQPGAAPAAPAAPTEASTAGDAPASMEKSDADLVAEFEKMLNT